MFKQKVSKIWIESQLKNEYSIYDFLQYSNSKVFSKVDNIMYIDTGPCRPLLDFNRVARFRLNVAFWWIFLKLVMLWVFKYLLPSYANYYFSLWLLHKHSQNCVLKQKRKLIYVSKTHNNFRKIHQNATFSLNLSLPIPLKDLACIDKTCCL